MPYHTKPKQKKFLGGMLKKAIKKRGGSRALTGMLKGATKGKLSSSRGLKKMIKRATTSKKRGVMARVPKKASTQLKRQAAAAKRQSKSGLSDAQKALLGSVQREAKKRGAGAITDKMVELTRKHGDHSGSKTTAKKATTQRRASSATTKAAKAKAEAMRRMRGRSGTRVKRGRVYSTTTGAARAKALAEAKKKAAAAKRRRGAVSRGRAAMMAARKRAAAAKRRRTTASTSRRRPSVQRRPSVLRGRRRPVSRRGRRLVRMIDRTGAMRR
jgi:colicin import membrane protein